MRGSLGVGGKAMERKAEHRSLWEAGLADGAEAPDLSWGPWFPATRSTSSVMCASSRGGPAAGQPLPVMPDRRLHSPFPPVQVNGTASPDRVDREVATLGQQPSLGPLWACSAGDTAIFAALAAITTLASRHGQVVLQTTDPPAYHG